MGTVRITADIAAGDVEIQRAFYGDEYLASDGKRELPQALADAANAVLRSYGIEEELAVVTEAAAALQRLRASQGQFYSKGKPVGD